MTRDLKSIVSIAPGDYQHMFTFGQDGSWNDPPECDFCGEKYKSLGVQVNLNGGLELCPECLLAGPKAVARKVWGLHHKDACEEIILEAAAAFGRLGTFKEIPGGILALAIAQGYRDTWREG